MENKLLTINNNQIITYLTIEQKIYVAYTKNETLENETEVYFAECSTINENNVLLPIVSNNTLSKVITKYDEYVKLMTDEEEYNILEEEDIE